MDFPLPSANTFIFIISDESPSFNHFLLANSQKEYQPLLMDKLILFFCYVSMRTKRQRRFVRIAHFLNTAPTSSKYTPRVLIGHFYAISAICTFSNIRSCIDWRQIGVIGVIRHPKNRVNTPFFTIKSSLSGTAIHPLWQANRSTASPAGRSHTRCLR